jgi:MoxR-like ATPase
MLRGRPYALPEDVLDLAHDVLRHRLVLSYEALAEGLSPDHIVTQIVQKVPKPDKPMAHRDDERSARAGL